MQEISNGRLEFRTGAGATREYATRWWNPFGIDYPNNSERISLLDEGLDVLRLLWNTPEVNFNGKYFKFNGTRLKNPTMPISITIAAMKRKMMHVVQNMRIYGNLPISPLDNFLLLIQNLKRYSKYIQKERTLKNP